MQPLIVLSPWFAELAIELACESCCTEGAEGFEGFVEVEGAGCCVPCAIDSAVKARQITSVRRNFFTSVFLCLMVVALPPMATIPATVGGFRSQPGVSARDRPERL